MRDEDASDRLQSTPRLCRRENRRAALWAGLPTSQREFISMIRANLCLFGLFTIAFPALAQGSGAVPRAVGDCAVARITELGSRLQGVPESGSAVTYENGL